MSPANTITLKGADRIIGNLKKLPKNLRKELDKITKQTAMEISNTAEQYSPRDKGDLKRGWEVDRESEAVYRVHNDTVQALPMETGFKLRKRSKTGWRVIPVKNPRSKYYPRLILDERKTHPVDKPGGHRMLEQAEIRHAKTFIKKTRNIWKRVWRK